jgi:hypothetical protein
MIVEEERIGMAVVTRVNSTGTGNVIRVLIVHVSACFGTKCSKRSEKFLRPGFGINDASLRVTWKW